MVSTDYILILNYKYYQRITSGAVGGDASASLSWQELSDDRVGRGSDGSPNGITDGHSLALIEGNVENARGLFNQLTENLEAYTARMSL